MEINSSQTIHEEFNDNWGNGQKKRTLPYLLVIFCIGFFAFIINNEVVPADLMESRNLATAQEMVRTGNYLVPTMNGELRLEKPPLPTWIAAGIEHLTPHNLPVQRAAAGVIAILMAVFLFLLVRWFTSDNIAALIASLVLISGFNVVMAGRTATWDIYCHSFMLGAIYFLVLALEKEGRQWGWFSLSGLFMGLSFLSKGPVSFYALLLPFLISYIVVMRPKAKGKIAPLCIMTVIFLIVSFWWPAYIALFHHDEGAAVLAKESGAWLSHNVRPIWYYWKFPAEAGIWTLFWVSSFIYYFRYRKENQKAFKFSIIWLLAGWVLLSLMPEKKTRYLLPILIPGAMNIAFYIRYSMQAIRTKGEKIIFRFNGIVIAVIALAIPFIVGSLTQSWFSFQSIILFVCCWGLAFYIFSAIAGKNKIKPFAVFTGTVLLMTAFEIFCLPAAGKMFINPDLHSIGELRHDPRIEKFPLFHDQNEHMWMQLVYEIDREILPLDLQNDSLVKARLPFVLVSSESISKQLENKPVSIEYLGTFDNNWKKKSDKRYNMDLVKEVAVIWPAEE